MRYLIVLCLLFALPVRAETTLDAVVVTATRNAKTLKDVPVRTEVISRATLQKEHARDAKQALRYAAGVLLKPVHGKTGSEAWLQGMDGNRVLVLINGERVTASTGSSVDLTQISVADIKQVEIVKGAASALHGSSAMGGVINIITREAEMGWHGKISSDVGSYGEYDRAGERRPAAAFARGALSYRNEQLELSLDADQRDSDGFLIPSDRVGADIHGQDGYKRNINTRLAYQPNAQSTITAAYRAYGEDHITHNIINVAGRGARYLPRSESADTQHYSLGLDYKILNADTTAGGGGSAGLAGAKGSGLKIKAYQENFSNQTFQTIMRRADISTRGVDVQFDKTFANDSVLSSGLSYNQESLDQLNNGVSEIAGGERQREAQEVFLQYDYWLTDHIEILPGLRYQDDSDFGDYTAPKISAMLSHAMDGGEGRLRLSYGNGYRVPNMKERYFIFDHSVNGYKVLGNPQLQPEQSKSYQLGYEWQDDDRWGWDANLFYNDIDDLIETAFVNFDNGLQIFRYVNVAEASTQGLELGSYLPLHERVNLRGSYTYLQTKNKTLGQYQGKELALRPEHLLKLSLDWSVWDEMGDFLLRYVYTSKEFIDEANRFVSPQAHVWDVKYTHQLSQHVSVYGGVDNIGNVHREPGVASDQRPVPGRFTYVGGSLSF